MKDELERLWKGDIIRKKIKDTLGDQEVPVPKRDIFDRKHPMFVGFHPAFDKKSEESKYQNAMTIFSMEIEKDQWNVMLAGEPDDLDDSSFSWSLF